MEINVANIEAEVLRGPLSIVDFIIKARVQRNKIGIYESAIISSCSYVTETPS